MDLSHTKLRVAAAQVAIGGDVEQNVRTIGAAIRRCAVLGAQIVVFPETAVSGYSPNIGHGRPPEDWPAVRAGIEGVRLAADQQEMSVAVGSEAWVEGVGWVNRYYLFDRDGLEVARYDKVHLTRADTAYHAPGDRYVTCDLYGVRVGLAICYDVRFPEGYRAMLAQGAQVVLQGFYGAGEKTWKVPVMGAHLRSRAAESGCFVVAANVSGPLQIVLSQIVDPLGLVLARANQDCEEIVVAELDLARIAESEVREDYIRRFGGAGA